ncbi:MAG: GNAT family N-acetyltransferase [Bacteroidales bacterium]|nr:GNAT family N-acetyltransferase [Bacteroidales bacterium]
MKMDRIILRPWLETDAPALFKYASDPEVGPRAGWPPHKSVEESLEIIRTVFNDATCTWAIVLKETGEPIGAMGYGPSCSCNLPAREGEPLIGYWVGRPYWNQGICTEALRMMIDRIRQTTEIKSLISGHFIDNPASGRVMEKCGFVPTGETVVDLEQGKDTPIRVLRLNLLSVKAANTGQTDAIMDVLEAAKGIMRASGNTGQWVNGYPSKEVIQKDLESGHGFVVLQGERIVGYFAFIPSPEPTYAAIYDGMWLDDSLQYHVVHRIGSYPEVHGVFNSIMDWCFSQDGNIRIDTHRDNLIMQHNILKYGFKYCGIIYLASGDERFAYQMMRR